MRFATLIPALIAFICVTPTSAVAAPAMTDTVFRLTEKSEPLVARQEKARGLLRAWEYVAPNFIIHFELDSLEGLAQIQQSLISLIGQQSSLTTAPAISDAAKHYLVYSIARAQMVNSIDFSSDKLRHFFEINAPHYPCSPRATVSELLIPKTYTNAAGTTAILDEIQQRLEKESFPRVAYQINDRLGKNGTGYLGEVPAKKVGPERFELYEQVARQGHKVGGSGNPVGGPFDTPAGWLFIQVHNFIGDNTDCFNAMRDRVAQDYGREWLKKIESDTLTTAARELTPQVTPFTTGTALESRAMVVGGHALTFLEARAELPYLSGNARDPRFWQSIQRQALELELIYHSSTGKAVRQLPEYAALEGTLRLLQAKRAELATRLKDETTTPTLRAWFEKNRARYSTFGDVSFQIYQCESEKSEPALNAPERARCTAALESLSSASIAQRSPAIADSLSIDAQWSTSPQERIMGVLVSSDEVTSATFTKLSREQQVALRNLQAGEWSPVFTENGQQKIIQLNAIDRKTPSFEEIAERVANDYKLDYEMEFWRSLGM